MELGPPPPHRSRYSGNAQSLGHYPTIYVVGAGSQESERVLKCFIGKFDKNST
jgi:hypothetical protein